MIEEWRPVVGLESTHEVSNFGVIRSFDRVTIRNGHPTKLRGQVIKQDRSRDTGHISKISPKIK